RLKPDDMSRPLTRIIGGVPALKWMSEIPLRTMVWKSLVTSTGTETSLSALLGTAWMNRAGLNHTNRAVPSTTGTDGNRARPPLGQSGFAASFEDVHG